MDSTENGDPPQFGSKLPEASKDRRLTVWMDGIEKNGGWWMFIFEVDWLAGWLVGN